MKQLEDEQELTKLARVVPLERSLEELQTVITRVKQGLDHEVDVVLARPITITSDVECASLTEAVKEARDTIDHVKERHAAIKKFAFQLHRFISSQENELCQKVDRWINGDRNGKGASQAIAAWIQAQQQKRLKEQQEVQRALDKQHEKAVEKTAKKLEKQGEPELANQVRGQAQYQRPIAYTPPVAIPTGATVKAQQYDFEITDPSLVPRAFCKPDESKLRKQVNLLGKDAIGSIPGVHVYPLDPKVQVRR